MPFFTTFQTLLFGVKDGDQINLLYLNYIILFLFFQISHAAPCNLDGSEASTEAFLIQDNGRVTFQKNTKGENHLFDMHSITKSVVAIAFFFAVEEKLLQSVDTPLCVYLNEWCEGLKRKITIRHLLNHTSGIEHESSDKILSTKEDMISFLNSKKVKKYPGMEFSYNNDAVQLLSEIFKVLSKRDIDSYLYEKLFKPLNIKDWTWKKDRKGHVITYTSLKLKLSDLAKIGQFILNDYNDEHFLSAKTKLLHFVRDSSSTNQNYGLLWWTWRNKAIYAKGWMGQYLFIEPEKNILVIRLNEFHGSRHDEFLEDTTNGLHDLPRKVSKRLDCLEKLVRR